MTKAKKNQISEMPSLSAMLPLPRTEERALVQGEVNKALREAVRAEMVKRKLKWPEVIEWGLSVYLMNLNPEKAAELGLKKPE